jgi:hypothetical protein
MNKKSASKSGFLNSRIILGIALCSVGVALGALVVAAPNQPQKADAQEGVGFKPMVRYSIYNGVSPKVSDLPVEMGSRNGEWESHQSAIGQSCYRPKLPRGCDRRWFHQQLRHFIYQIQSGHRIALKK